jgi:hypothetical protein
MSAPATPQIPLSTGSSASGAAGRALLIGLSASAVTWLGALVTPVHLVATAWLLGLCYWTAITVGFLMLIMIHHVFDAMWAIALRRQLEHGLAAFKWLALLFIPLFLISYFGPRDVIWPWLNPSHFLTAENKTVGADLVYAKKSGFLNFRALVGGTAAIFAVWCWLSARLRRASFRQDLDGDVKWTVKNRFTSGFGIPLAGIALTAAAIYWIKSLEYHWFSTMYGVWFFADCMRGCLSIGVLIMLWLWNRGDYKGILHKGHLHSIGQLMLAFTVFWAYIAFSQYFLIWNANVPEETFWFNEREFGDWWWVGMFIVFVNFLLPFCLLLSYRFKVEHRSLRRIACLILATLFVDFCWNILPALKDAHGDALPFLSLNLLWSLTAVIGVGGVWVWAYLRSFPTAKLIPVRDPRIGECLTHHE